MPRDLRTIMRGALRLRRAGVSAPVSLMANLADDSEWDVIFDRLVRDCELEASLERLGKQRRKR